jgi:hypothetical protein
MRTGRYVLLIRIVAGASPLLLFTSLFAQKPSIGAAHHEIKKSLLLAVARPKAAGPPSARLGHMDFVVNVSPGSQPLYRDARQRYSATRRFQSFERLC